MPSQVHLLEELGTEQRRTFDAFVMASPHAA